MSENQFAKLTVRLWRLHQRYERLQKGAARGVPTAITKQHVNQTRTEIESVLRRLNPIPALEIC